MNPYLDLLYRALESELGTLVETEDPIKLQQKLYRTRKAQADPLLNCLLIAPYPADPDNKLWIVKNVKKQAPAKSGDASPL